MDIKIEDGLAFIFTFTSLWVIAVSVGLAFSIAELFVIEIKRFREMATRPLFFISGVFFALQDFPREYWHWLNWNPVLQAIELARFAAYPTYGNEGVSFEFLGFTALSVLTISLILYQGFWRLGVSR